MRWVTAHSARSASLPRKLRAAGGVGRLVRRERHLALGEFLLRARVRELAPSGLGAVTQSVAHHAIRGNQLHQQMARIDRAEGEVVAKAVCGAREPRLWRGLGALIDWMLIGHGC